MGVTLVELLVVIVILVLLVGVVLPLVQPSLEGRDLREAARQASTFLMSAQAQASATGRKVGVMFVRDSVNTNRCFQLKLAREPSPYLGDVVTARATILNVDTDDAGSIPDTGRAYFGDVSATDPSMHALAVASFNNIMTRGATIKFNYRGTVFTVIDWQLHPPADTPTGSSQWAVDFLPMHPNPPGGMVEFQIFRTPEVTSAPPLELPGNTCIDLSLSGVSATGTFTSDSVNGDPVMLTFAPDGSVDALYLSWDTAPADGTVDTWIRCQNGSPFPCPYGNTFYFLVGRPNQVVSDVDTEFVTPVPPPLSITFPTFLISDELEDIDTNMIADFLESGNENNLQNPNNFWVTLDTRTGSVTTTANNSFTVRQPLRPTDDYRLPFATALARQLALTRQGVGSR